jgi:septal ring factor EnvC (AmiA/AmiB activator)
MLTPEELKKIDQEWRPENRYDLEDLKHWPARAWKTVRDLRDHIDERENSIASYEACMSNMAPLLKRLSDNVDNLEAENKRLRNALDRALCRLQAIYFASYEDQRAVASVCGDIDAARGKEGSRGT